MQTRRDQLQAYRFQNRRALAALVTGEPNVVEPPMRRLTAITVSGIMIAILIAAGFALVGVFKPTTGDSWKESGAIIVERETGARYVLLDDKLLHPVLNYSSAVLAVGTNQHPHVVLVDRSDLTNAKRGPAIGIDGIPDSLPSASSLVTAPWTVCSRQESDRASQLHARVSVLAGSDAGARPLAAGTGVVVRSTTSADLYLLLQGRRLAISSASVGNALQLLNARTLEVGAAFLNGIPAGPTLKPPAIPKVGDPFGKAVSGKTPVVGQLLHIKDNNQYFVVLSDGVAQVDEVEATLLRTLPLTSTGQPLAPIETDETTEFSLPQSKIWATVGNPMAGLPDHLPTVSSAASGNGGICAVYRKASMQPVFAVPPSELPAYANPSVLESPQSRQGRADTVVLRPGSGAVVRSSDGAKTVFVIADPGKKYAAASADVLSGFGYGNVKPVALPVQLLPLIPTGPALDPTAARRPVTG